MSSENPFESMLEKVAEAIKAELGPTYVGLVAGPDMGVAVAAKVALAVANVADNRMLDRSNQRIIKAAQEACLRRIFMACVAESFQNKALLGKIQTAVVQAAAASLAQQDPKENKRKAAEPKAAEPKK